MNLPLKEELFFDSFFLSMKVIQAGKEGRVFDLQEQTNGKVQEAQRIPY